MWLYAIHVWHRLWLRGGETEGTSGRFIFNNTAEQPQMQQNEMFASNKPQVAGVVQSEIINTNRNELRAAVCEVSNIQ